MADFQPTPSASAQPQFGQSQQSTPLAEMQKVLGALETTDPEVNFVKKDNTVQLDRAALEMMFSAYSQAMQNPQLYNKWLGIDEKMNKSLRQYKSDIRLLIAEQTSQGQAQAMVQDQVPGTEPPAAPAPAPAPSPAPGSAPTGKDIPPR